MDGESDLTVRQKQVLACVRDSLEQKGRPPACREIMASCGLATPSTVAHHVARLEKAGYLVREPRIARGLRLTARGEAAARAAQADPEGPFAEAEACTGEDVR
jgi:repressor LexA